MNDNMNILILAYLGDAVYEEHVRAYLVKHNPTNINDLYNLAINYVSATKQALFTKNMLANDFLSEQESGIIMRGRNHKSAHNSKSATIVDYKYATGLEALIGYLYLENNNKRIDEIINYIMGGNNGLS